MPLLGPGEVSRVHLHQGFLLSFPLSPHLRCWSHKKTSTESALLAENHQVVSMSSDRFKSSVVFCCYLFSVVYFSFSLLPLSFFPHCSHLSWNPLDKPICAPTLCTLFFGEILLFYSDGPSESFQS